MGGGAVGRTGVGKLGGLRERDTRWWHLVQRGAEREPPEAAMVRNRPEGTDRHVRSSFRGMRAYGPRCHERVTSTFHEPGPQPEPDIAPPGGLFFRNPHILHTNMMHRPTDGPCHKGEVDNAPRQPRGKRASPSPSHSIHDATQSRCMPLLPDHTSKVGWSGGRRCSPPSRDGWQTEHSLMDSGNPSLFVRGRRRGPANDAGPRFMDAHAPFVFLYCTTIGCAASVRCVLFVMHSHGVGTRPSGIARMRCSYQRFLLPETSPGGSCLLSQKRRPPRSMDGRTPCAYSINRL